MDLRQLRYVVALARERHFSRAARSANVAQPTLSQQLKKLEQELGSPLFERSSGGARLTAAGERFIPQARAVLDQLQQAVSDVQATAQEASGTIRLGAIPTMCPYVMPRVVRALRADAPGITLELFEETTSLLLDSLKTGKLDLGLLALPIQDRAVATLSLGREEFLLAVAQDHPLASASRIRPQRLAQERLLILQEGHCFRNQSLDYCRKTIHSPQIIFQGSSLTSVMQLAAAGEGVTLVPQMAADPSRNPHLRFLRFAPPRPFRELGVAWRLSAPLTRAQQRVLRLLGSALTLSGPA